MGTEGLSGKCPREKGTESPSGGNRAVREGDRAPLGDVSPGRGQRAPGGARARERRARAGAALGEVPEKGPEGRRALDPTPGDRVDASVRRPARSPTCRAAGPAAAATGRAQARGSPAGSGPPRTKAGGEGSRACCRPGRAGLGLGLGLQRGAGSGAPRRPHRPSPGRPLLLLLLPLRSRRLPALPEPEPARGPVRCRRPGGLPAAGGGSAAGAGTRRRVPGARALRAHGAQPRPPAQRLAPRAPRQWLRLGLRAGRLLQPAALPRAAG